MDLLEIKGLAERLRRGTRDRGVLELCDAILGYGLTMERVRAGARGEGCPVCLARREKQRARVKRFRGK